MLIRVPLEPNTEPRAVPKLRQDIVAIQSRKQFQSSVLCAMIKSGKTINTVTKKWSDQWGLSRENRERPSNSHLFSAQY